MAKAKTQKLFTTKLELSEADFQRQVVHVAQLNGWKVYSIPDSRRATMAGYPDLTMWRGKRLVFAELKRESGKLSVQQKIVLDELQNLPVEVYVWKPSNWDAIETILSRAYKPKTL